MEIALQREWPSLYPPSTALFLTQLASPQIFLVLHKRGY